MLNIHFGKKKTAVVIVILILLPLLVYLMWISPELLGLNVNLELSPKEVRSGEITSFVVKISGDEGIVRLPENTLHIVDGFASTERNLSFDGNKFMFDALIPPNVDMVNITVDMGAHSKTFHLDVEKSSNPLVSGDGVYRRMEHVTNPVHGMMHRVTSHPQLEVGARYFRDVFESFGLEAEIIRYWFPSGDNPIRKAVGVFIWNVVAYHWGANTKEWIVLGGHYDMSWETVEGAYDNTAGTNSVVEVARAISQIKTNKTIVFGLWAGEEEGLWGAQKFCDTIPEDVTIKTYLNFDMAGINYPAPYALNAFIGPDDIPDEIEQKDLVRLTNKTAHDMLQYPRVSGVYVKEQDQRGSDHYRFEQIGVPTVFFYGLSASDYEGYHNQDDTLETMIKVAGGVENLIGGFDTVAWMGFYLTIVLDNDDTVHQWI